MKHYLDMIQDIQDNHGKCKRIAIPYAGAWICSCAVMKRLYLNYFQRGESLLSSSAFHVFLPCHLQFPLTFPDAPKVKKEKKKKVNGSHPQCAMCTFPLL